MFCYKKMFAILSLKVPWKIIHLHIHASYAYRLSVSWSSLLTVTSRQQIHLKLTHNYNTRANYKRRMELTDNENQELKAQVYRLSALVENLLATQAAHAAQLQTAQAQVAKAQDAQIQAQAQAAHLQAQTEEAQARAQAQNTGRISGPPQLQNQYGSNTFVSVHFE